MVKITLGDAAHPSPNTINGDLVRTIRSVCDKYIVQIIGEEREFILDLLSLETHNHVPMPLNVAKAALEVVGVDTLGVDLALQTDGSYVVTERPQRFATKVAAYCYPESTIYHLDDWNGQRVVVDMGKGDAAWTIQKFEQCRAMKVTEDDARDALRHLCVDFAAYEVTVNHDKTLVRGIKS